MNFLDIEYLKDGNQRQKEAYTIIKRYQVWDILADFNPVLVGTIPIYIDILSSDLDIICKTRQLDEFEEHLRNYFEKESGFILKQKELRGIQSVVCRFVLETKTIEIVGQPIDTTKQVAYLHMIIESQILEFYGDEFKKQIIELKKEGYKTEPAFAKLLGIDGDPYLELLNFKLPKV